MVVSIVVIALPFAPDTAFSLPIGFRLYRNKRGVTKGRSSTSERRRKRQERRLRKCAETIYRVLVTGDQ